MGKRTKWVVRGAAVGIAAATVLVYLGPRVDSEPPPQPARPTKEVRLERVFEDVELQQPVWMEQAPGDPSTWYVLEQPGRIVTFPDDPDASEKRVVLDIGDRVKFGGEQGLLGSAFHPEFQNNGVLIVNYTSEKSGHRETRISRFRRTEDGSFDPDSEEIVLRVGQPYANHNGGQVIYGPDGYLYVGFGDGGLAGDPKDHGQNTRTLLGTMVRIEVGPTGAYSIPKDNPFADAKKGAPEVFAWGLRNPWRFSFDPKTDKLWAGDVGQNAWEEITIVGRGENHGWNAYEGTHCYDPPLHLKPLGTGDCTKEPSRFTMPVHDYSQRLGDKSVTGGYVYRGDRVEAIEGDYVYGDFVSGRVWALDAKTHDNRLLLDTDINISSFVRARDGEIGLLSYGDGAVYHITD